MIEKVLADLVDGLNKTRWSSWQTTAHFDDALRKAEEELKKRQKKKARITVTFEYELDPDNYSTYGTVDEMLGVDVDTLRENLAALYDALDNHEYLVRGEIVEKES